MKKERKSNWDDPADRQAVALTARSVPLTLGSEGVTLASDGTDGLH